MKQGNRHHGFMLVVLFCQITCLATLALDEDLVWQNKWVGALFGFSLLFGLILSLGFYGMWRKRRDEVSLFAFLQAHPVYLEVAIATAGQMVSILLVRKG